MAAIVPYGGARWQRGYGLASVFRGLFRTAIPFLKSRLGRTVVRTGVGLAGDALRGRNMKEALGHRVMQGIGDVITGGPRAKKRPRRSPTKRRVTSTKVKKRRRGHHGDIFG